MRLAISTGGGDAPGLNSVIRAATLSALRRGWEVVGIRDGFDGLMFPDRYPEGEGASTSRGTSCAASPTSAAPCSAARTAATRRRSRCSNPTAPGQRSTAPTSSSSCSTPRGVDALITIGGDGSLAIGHRLHQAGLRVIGVPKTIDNDLDMTEATFGFDTAVGVATEGIDRLFTTATSHSRLFVVEVMGRYAGWIALHAGMAAAAHGILIPEIPFDLDAVADMIRRREARGPASRSSSSPKGPCPRTAVGP